MPRISKELRQAKDLQDFSYQALMGLKQTLTKEGEALTVTREDAAAIAQLSRAWDTATERRRILTGKRLPGTERPPKVPAKSGRNGHAATGPSPSLAAPEISEAKGSE